LSVIDTFGKWHEQLQADPYGNAPRIQREIAERINGSIGMQQAHAHLAEYERQYRISAEERPVMQRMLTTGEAHSLPQAHALARQELALNVKDDIARDVTRASRQVQAPQMAAARVAVDEFARVTGLKRGSATWNKMQKLLESEKAWPVRRGAPWRELSIENPLGFF
jgi:hypothetical protein